jgi:hypothetical protein
MRQALNEGVTESLLVRKSVTQLKGEYMLQQAAMGARDLDRLKASAIEKLGALPIACRGRGWG